MISKSLNEFDQLISEKFLGLSENSRVQRFN